MPYPVILNGDHAEFEREHASTPPHERPDWPLPSFDARDWAAAFCKTFIVSRIAGYLTKPEEDQEGLMIAWFANALMRGFDEHSARASHEAREFVAGWMMERGYATGHGDTIGDLLTELEGEANDHGARGVPPRRIIDAQ